MEYIAYIFIALVTLMLTGLGLVSMFSPQKMLANFALEPQGIKGLNSIRSIMGGLFLSCVTLLIHGLITGQTTYFIVVAVVLGGIAIGRVVGLFADGFDKSIIPPLVVEIVIISALIFSAQHIKNSLIAAF